MKECLTQTLSVLYALNANSKGSISPNGTQGFANLAIYGFLLLAMQLNTLTVTLNVGIGQSDL
jgi:hypothetical protein